MIEGVGLALADDDNFRRFNRVLTDEKDTTIHGTFEGTFFVGHVKDATGRESGGGYGHMGCCSLFVLQSVDDFDPHTRKDVDYTAEAGYYENPVCKASASRTLKYVSVTYSLTDAQQAIADQQLADNGSRAWAFHDPDRVAAESIASLYPPPLPQLHKVKSTAAREVLDASWGKKRTVVVLTRPYWLSFYAVSGTVAWTATKVEEFDCR